MLTGSLGKTAIDAIEEINTLFERVRAFKQTDTGLVREYQGYIHDVTSNLKKHFDSAELSKSVKLVELLKSKFFLLDVCFEKAVYGYQEAHLHNDPFVTILEMLRHQVCSTFIALAEVQQQSVMQEVN